MAKANKMDLRKKLKHLYAPSAKKVEIVDVPEFKFAMVDGQLKAGEAPGASPVFQNALQALYGISFTLKFMSKMRKVNPIDYTVMTMEGLWWTNGGKFDFDKKRPWKFTAMMLQPEHITRDMYLEALKKLKGKKDNPALTRLRFETFGEGLCVQTMHIGPYSEEAATLEKMESFAKGNGLEYHGKHHEIYLGDPRRCQPEKLRTVLRHPVKRMG